MVIASVAGAAGVAGPALAQQYPSKPVRVLVGFAAGGSVDLVARTLSQSLSSTYGRQVIVDNRPGAASHIAGGLVAKAEPDGYTLLVSSQGGLGTNLALYSKMPYNPLKELTPISQLVNQAQVLIVNPKVEARSVKEFIALARSKPGALNYGSAGSGGPLHLAAELFSSMTGTKMTHIIYKGGAPAITDLIGGQIDLTFQPMPEALPYIKAGRVRTLAVTSPARSPSLPDIPTIAEAGVPGYAWMSWMGVAGPAGMPAALTAQISADWNRALTAGDMPARMLEMGVEVAGSTPEQFGAHMRSETEKMARLVKDAGIPLVE
jgi:tripartite-type tricarboxylate transporter receptor subunit TctC